MQQINDRPISFPPPSSTALMAFFHLHPPSPPPPSSQRVQDAEWKLILPQCEEASYSAGEVIVAASNGPSNR